MIIEEHRSQLLMYPEAVMIVNLYDMFVRLGLTSGYAEMYQTGRFFDNQSMRFGVRMVRDEDGR